MGDKLIHIPNDDDQNYPCCRLKLFVVKFDYYLMKLPIVLCQRIGSRILKTLDTSVIYSLMS